MNIRPVFSLLFLILFAGALFGQTPVLIKDINVDEDDSKPLDLIMLNDLVFFYADDGIHGYELWKSDGTSGGTTMVKDIMPGGEGSMPKYEYSIITTFKRTVFTGHLYFLAKEGGSLILWKSDGSTEGTTPVKVLNDSFEKMNSRSGEFVIWENRFFFSLKNELWISDGTTEGTMVHESFGESIRNLISDGETMYFDKSRYIDPSNQQGNYYIELFTGDGTNPAMKIAKLATGTPGVCGVSINGFMLGDQPVHLISNYCSGTSELWLDGGLNISFNSLHGYIEDPVMLNNKIYFGAPALSEPCCKSALLEFDGMAFNEIQIFDGQNHAPRTIVHYQDKLFFTGFVSEFGKELWISDGTSDGTYLLEDLHPGGAWSNPLDYAVLEDGVYFSAFGENPDLDIDGHGLWKSDGIQTELLAVFEQIPHPDINQIHRVNGHLIYVAETYEYGREIWTIEESPISGTTSFSLGEDLLVFPNPANKTLNIDGLPQSLESPIIELFDGQGKRILNRSIPIASPKNGLHQLNIEKLIPGIYFLNIQVNEKIYSQKFLKK